MNDYKEVNLKQYVEEGIANQTMVPFVAEKFARVFARQGTIGESVTIYMNDSLGNIIGEKEDFIIPDEITGQPGWIVTHLDENGEVVRNKDGNVIEKILSDSKFKEKYEKDLNIDSVYKPKDGTKRFVILTENISIDQWGSKMQFQTGSYVDITNPDTMYAMTSQDFNSRYRRIAQ